MLLVNRRSLAGLCAAGAVALAAGCGGGGDDGSALSAGEFRTQADAICQTSKDTIAALTEPTSSSTNAEVSAFLTAGLEATDAEIAKLRALEAPSDVSGTLDEALDLLEQRQERIRAATGRVAGGEDVQAVLTDANAEIDNLNSQADAKARELGLTVCGTHDDDLGESTTSTATTPTAPTTTGAPSAEVTAHLQAVGTTLSGVIQVLQTVSNGSLDDVKAAIPEAREKLTEFDDAVATLASDTGSGATQERARAAVAAAGPKLSQALSRLFDALEDGDQAAAAAVVPDVQQTLQELQTALAG
jgi:hypothetical protein